MEWEIPSKTSKRTKLVIDQGQHQQQRGNSVKSF